MMKQNKTVKFNKDKAKAILVHTLRTLWGWGFLFLDMKLARFAALISGLLYP